MQLLTILDLSVYLIAGVALVLYADSVRQAGLSDEERAERSIAQRCGVWLMALVVGVLAGGGRYFITQLGKWDALSALSPTFEQAKPSIDVLGAAAAAQQ